MKINGTMYRDMVISAACALENEKEAINNLNVFPVPDGDTGINMSLTMSGVRGDFSVFDAPVGETAQKAANLMLRGARGNSGVILSLFFRGISKVWSGLDEADCGDVIRAVKRGVAEAYKAVMNPTEGTILTVMRVMAETADEALENGVVSDETELFEFMLAAARETLDKTPELLPILKQAGVVDSGGCGFVAVMDGMTSALKGSPVTAQAAAAAAKSAADFGSFDTDDIKFAYCTECIVTKSRKFTGENTARALHDFICGIGDSAVFVDDSEIIKLHVHTNEPGRVLTEAQKYGSLYTVKIENMKLQHSSLSGESEKEAEPDPEPEAEKPAEITKPFGFVTVCMGDGFSSIFGDLGADVIVSGGQTMNPSTEDILRAVEKTPAETVFVLPNNKNIYLVSRQAAKVSTDRKVIVLETSSVPEGISAMLAFDEAFDAEANKAAMEQAIKGVTTLSVTYAVRDTKIDGTQIHEGETLGLLNGKIKCAADDRMECIRTLAGTVDAADIVTLYYGEGVAEDEAAAAEDIIKERLPDAEIMTLCGGQPVYSYVISAE